MADADADAETGATDDAGGAPVTTGDQQLPEGATGDVTAFYRPDDRLKPMTEKKDPGWAVAFYVHLAIMVLFAIVTFIIISIAAGSSAEYAASGTNIDIDGRFIALLLIMIIIGTASAGVWILIIQKFATQLIWLAMGLCLAMWITYAVVGLFIQNGIAIVIMGLLCAAIQVLWMWCIRDRIKFAGCILEMAATATNKYQYIYMISFISIGAQAIWAIIWFLGFIAVIIAILLAEAGCDDTNVDTSDDCTDQTLWQIIIFILLISLYWTAQVITNVVHVTSCGTVATWYFLYTDGQEAPQDVVKGAFKRAMTTSFGSICFGSFLVAVIQALRAMANSGKARGGIGALIIGCILRCIEQIIQYFNTYAFARVAIYGMNFCDAAKETWELFKARGITMIINDDLTGVALGLAAFFAGLLSGVLMAVIAVIFGEASWVLWAVLGFVVGMVFTMVATVCVRSGVVTIFVCFSEDPAALANTKREWYDRLTEAWRARYEALAYFLIY